MVCIINYLQHAAQKLCRPRVLDRLRRAFDLAHAPRPSRAGRARRPPASTPGQLLQLRATPTADVASAAQATCLATRLASTEASTRQPAATRPARPAAALAATGAPTVALTAAALAATVAAARASLC